MERQLKDHWIVRLGLGWVYSEKLLAAGEGEERRGRWRKKTVENKGEWGSEH